MVLLSFPQPTFQSSTAYPQFKHFDTCTSRFVSGEHPTCSLSNLLLDQPMKDVAARRADVGIGRCARGARADLVGSLPVVVLDSGTCQRPITRGPWRFILLSTFSTHSAPSGAESKSPSAGRAKLTLRMARLRVVISNRPTFVLRSSNGLSVSPMC